MEVIPAIDLLQGQCVRLYQGDYDRSEVFSTDPLTVAREWQTQGATRLHVVDLDAAKTGDPTNYPMIAELVRTLGIPVQVGGGIRSLGTAEQLLALGVARVILGTVAVENPDLVKLLCERHPDKIIVGIDARDGQVATRGWLASTGIPATELIARLQFPGLAAIIYTDIQRDGTQAGANIGQLREVLAISSTPIIASGGVGSLSDLLSLLALVPQGLQGVIVGKALYARSFTLVEAIRAVGSGRWQDLPLDGSSLA